MELIPQENGAVYLKGIHDENEIRLRLQECSSLVVFTKDRKVYVKAKEKDSDEVLRLIYLTCT